MGLFTRSIRPPEIPNSNDPAATPPNTVGPPTATAGDPDGVLLAGADPPAWMPPSIRPSAWSGWPADWQTPNWSSGMPGLLPDTAWMCVDKNASALAAMPPYLKDAADSLQTSWLANPDPDVYTGWGEFMHQLVRDYQVAGEAFVLATSRYATGYPARFHVVPPWMVTIDMENGLRHYSIGGESVDDDILHIRYWSQVGYAHGMGPLEAAGLRVRAAQLLVQYASNLVAGGGIPSGVLEHPGEISPAQAQQMKVDWVAARASGIGEPAVLSGGIKWTPTQINPQDLGLTGLLDKQESRIAYLLGVPSELVGIPTNTDPMTYKNMTMWLDLHWRTGLNPIASRLMQALSGWALPSPTSIELNRDEYIRGEPYERAQAYQILAGIVDPVTGQQAMTVDEIRDAERLDDTTPNNLSSGVLK